MWKFGKDVLGRPQRSYRIRFNFPYAGKVETKVLTFLYLQRNSSRPFYVREIARAIHDSHQDTYGALYRLYRRRYVIEFKEGRHSLWFLNIDAVRLVEEELAYLGVREAIEEMERREQALERERRLREVQEYESYISGAKGLEPAGQVLRKVYRNGQRNIRIVVRTYRWSNDGPFDKEDYEPIIYFYENNKGRPKHAITFSHYGCVYHKNLLPWDGEDYSPRFPNSFHTPLLKAEKVDIKDGVLSWGAYAATRVTSLREQTSVEPVPSDCETGLPPDSVEISDSVKQVIGNREGYLDELKRL